MSKILVYIIGILLGIGLLIYSTYIHAKDDPNLPIHAWCVPGTLQWKTCSKKVYYPEGWESALAGMSNCIKEKK